MVGCTIQSLPGPEWDLSGYSLMSLVHVQEQFCGESLTCTCTVYKTCGLRNVHVHTCMWSCDPEVLREVHAP